MYRDCKFIYTRHVIPDTDAGQWLPLGSNSVEIIFSVNW